jgi:hypothetical protein
MADSRFWKEREDEFRRHDSEENGSLAADWSSITSTWTFRGGSGERSERIFKSLARKAARGLKCPPGADTCTFWLDSLRLGKYNFEPRFSHEEAYNQERWEYLAKSGEAVPVVEGIAEKVARADGSVENRTRFEGNVGTIERLFKTSADFCLELGSHAPSEASAEAQPDGTGVIGSDAHGAGVTPPIGGSPARSTPQVPPSVLRRHHKDREIEEVRVLARQWLADGATHHQICQRLKDKPRPCHAAWRHLAWDKAFNEDRYRNSVRKWLSKNCRP